MDEQRVREIVREELAEFMGESRLQKVDLNKFSAKVASAIASRTVEIYATAHGTSSVSLR